MGMPASLAGDMSLGHAFSPSPITPTTTNVMVEKKIPHVASTTVFFGGKAAARLMDTADCGAQILGTSATVLVG